MNIPLQAIQIIKEFEGCKLTVYKDSANLPTIGIGHLIKPGEHFTTITMQEAENLLAQDLAVTVRAVMRLITVVITEAQYSALLSFTFNVGGAALQRSTLRQKLNRGEYKNAAQEFPKYCYAGGRKIPGLLRRRLAEQKLFLL